MAKTARSCSPPARSSPSIVCSRSSRSDLGCCWWRSGCEIRFTRRRGDAEMRKAATIIATVRIAIASGTMRGPKLADALFANWLAVTEDASLAIDSPEAWAGVLWRIGAEALRFRLLAANPLPAAAALAGGIADSLFPAGVRQV